MSYILLMIGIAAAVVATPKHLAGVHYAAYIVLLAVLYVLAIRGERGHK